MATAPLTLPFWPASLDCVSWSEDNVIAVVGGENIAVLTPRFRDIGAINKQWDVTVIQVNAFTAAETPLRTPLSKKYFSIGEELSLRQATSAKWSYQGLARHGRCALAVLTADHVLSVWTSEGSLTVSENWKRQLVINITIRNYYAGFRTDQDAGDTRSKQEFRQVQQRITTYMWSKPVYQHDPAITPSETLDWGQQFLAVATGAGDILFVRVTSPYGSLHVRSSGWNSYVTGSLNVGIVATTLVPNPSAVLHMNSERWIADFIAWGDWKADQKDGNVTTLAYISCGKLFTAALRASGSDTLTKVDAVSDQDAQWQWHLRDCLRIRGPVRFVPSSLGSESLVTVVDDAVINVPIHQALKSGEDLNYHHLGDQWDDVFGVALTHTGNSHVRLHFVSELSSNTSLTSVLELPFLTIDERNARNHPWQRAMNASKAAFGAESDLEGHVVTRICGQAASPLGDYLATCAFFQPSDALAYVIQSEQTSILNISHEFEPCDGNILPDQNFSTRASIETILFCLQRYMENRSLLGAPSTNDQDTLMANLLKYFPSAPDNENLASMELNNTSHNALVKHLRTKVYVHWEMRKSRASRIADIAMGVNASRPQISPSVVQQLIHSVLKLPVAAFHMDEYSINIRRIFGTILSKLLTNQVAANEDGLTKDGSEVCKMCQQYIPFESIRWAACLSGHQYARCALSFLAIQEPGTSKSCGVCDLRYLDETKLAGFLNQDNHLEILDMSISDSNPSDSCKTTESGSTLAQILFAACNVCIHCGGKYTD